MQFLQKRAGSALDWVIRLPRYLGVAREAGASPVPLAPGQAVDLGSRSAARVQVVGLGAHGRHEPWWLATNLSWPVAKVAAAYDRRAAGREGRPDALQRLWLLVGLALWMWWAEGAAAAAAVARAF